MFPANFLSLPGVHCIEKDDFLLWVSAEIPPSSPVALNRVINVLFSAGVDRIWVARPDRDWLLVEGVWDWQPKVDLLVIQDGIPELLDWTRPNRMRSALGVNFIASSSWVSSVAVASLIEFLATGPDGNTRPVALVIRANDPQFTYGNQE